MKIWLTTISIALLATTQIGCGDDGEESTTGETSRVDTILALTGNASVGQSLYGANCGSSSCHGSDGMGTGTPSEALQTAVPILTRRELVELCVNGIGSMPPVVLPDQELADVIEYTIDEFGPIPN
ncbi:MAG: cytochrome c [Myxococcota bacterium]